MNNETECRREEERESVATARPAASVSDGSFGSCGQSDETKRRESGRFGSNEGPAGVRPRRTLASRFGRQRAESREQNRRYGEGNAY